MTTQPIRFGTDGWRAVMDREFTPENVERLAQAISLYFKEVKPNGTPRVAVGYDFRKNSENYAALVTQVLLANHIEVQLSDCAVPTPAVSRAVVKDKLDFGIAITASHNPGEYNGVKIKDSQGSSADVAVTRRIEELIDRSPIQKSSNDKVVQAKRNIMGPYVDAMKAYLRLDWFDSHPYRVLVDSMHGVGAKLAEEILKKRAVSVKTLRAERKYDFGGNAPEPILKNVKEAAELMTKNHYDIAILTDGDADRIGALAPGGVFVSPGKILSLIMLHFVEDLGMKGEVVTTVSNTGLIYKIAGALGLKIHETPVGFKYIVEIMKKSDVLIAGEESGGLAFKGYMPERDGVLSGLLLVQMMEKRGKTLEQILDEVDKKYGKFYYVRKDIAYPQEKKDAFFNAAKNVKDKTIAGLTLERQSTMDGIKFYFSDGSWLLFRMSGTEPLMRIYAETQTEGKEKALVDWGEALAKSV